MLHVLRQVGGAVRAASEPLRAVLRLTLSAAFAGVFGEKDCYETAPLLGRNALETLVAALCLAPAGGPRAVLGAVRRNSLFLSPCAFFASSLSLSFSLTHTLGDPSVALTARKESFLVFIRFP